MGGGAAAVGGGTGAMGQPGEPGGFAGSPDSTCPLQPKNTGAYRDTAAKQTDRRRRTFMEFLPYVRKWQRPAAVITKSVSEDRIAPLSSVGGIVRCVNAG